jgi:uncharacterized protein YndB with AHSA1/START domain
MGRIYASIQIPASPEAVFDYATTPTNAPQWHPTSVGVSGDIDHSLKEGERSTEELVVFAGRRVRATWTMVERIFPSRWMIEGTPGPLARGTITTTFSAQANGTFYEREFVYTMANPVLVLMDWLVLHRHGEAAAQQAVRTLRNTLESHSQAGRVTTQTDGSRDPCRGDEAA